MFADTGLFRLRSHLRVAVLSLRFQVATWDIFILGGTSATQRQKFPTDCIDGCLHYKSGSPWVPNANLFNFHFSCRFQMVKYCVHLQTSSSKTQMLLLAKNIIINRFAPGDFAEKGILKLVEWFSGHCRAIKS